jgi:cell division protein FtsA
VLYRDGGPYLTGVLPVGGAHLTNDLALGLRLTEGQAEKLKLRTAARSSRPATRREGLARRQLLHRRPPVPAPHAIEQITAARTWEIFEVVKKKLGSAFVPGDLRRRRGPHRRHRQAARASPSAPPRFSACRPTSANRRPG